MASGGVAKYGTLTTPHGGQTFSELGDNAFVRRATDSVHNFQLMMKQKKNEQKTKI